MKRQFKMMAVTMMTTAAMLSAAPAAVFADVEAFHIDNVEDATLSMLQVIKADPTEKTGWSFVNSTISAHYKTAFGSTDETEIIVRLMLSANPELDKTTLPADYNGVIGATPAQIDQALGLILNDTSLTFSAYQEENNAAGLYVVKATEPGYQYKPMAVYQDFAKVNSSVIEAKKSKEKIEKKITNTEAQDQAVAIGDTVEYEVTTDFPYFAVTTDAATRSYRIKDTIEGAAYNQDSFEVTIGSDTVDSNVITFTDNSFTVDLDTYARDAAQSYANREVKIIYTATVTNPTAKNTVGHKANDEPIGEDTDIEVYTGTITLKKTNEDGTKPLAGAQFSLMKSGATEPLRVRQDVDNDGNPIPGKYTYAPGVETALLTVETAGTDGSLEVKGLDEGTYHFTEVKAPAGYSINEKGIDVTLDAGEKAEAIFTVEGTMKDTKLSALPSTGSIGTYLFTIIGVGVMAFMASMFTIKRRRDAK